MTYYLRFSRLFQNPPVLDLQTHLAEALVKGRLILTLPWIVEFCSILDDITLQTRYYQKLFETMVQIYKVGLRI